MLIAGFIFAGMRFHSYLNSVKKIIDAYDGSEPLSNFLKKYFAANKKYGSKDRKRVTALCYDFYRLGKAMPGLSIEEKIITGTFLCEHSSNEFLAFHKPEWNAVIEKPLSEKADLAGISISDVFSWQNELSIGIDRHLFCSSFFTQPDLFLRLRPGKKNAVLKKLQETGLHYDMPGEDCISLPNNTKLEGIIELDKDAVVQDRNSQQVLNVLKDPVSSIRYPVSSILHPVSTWDCCAASGGKSLLAYDILNGKIALTVSDIRENILSNLKKRFSTAGIKNYKSFIADLQAADCKLPIADCQLIICDAPCTGSGTWSRTPEQVYFFKEEMIAAYAGRQQQIVSNVIPYLEKGGMFIYITCSVFKKENEEIVNFIKEKFHLRLIQMEFLKGYDKKADSMFAAAFINE